MVEVIINISNRKVVNLGEFKSAFSQLKDGRHLVTVKDMRRRSLPQNAYYWGVIVPMIRQGLYDSGYDDVRTNDDAHEILKHIHLKKRMINKQTGEVIDIGGSTAELSIPEFNDFIERICRWSAEFLGVVIPSPNEQMVMFNEWQETIEK